ncbi:HAMP domain-containing sensor histidine kinase [Streptomyces sp. ZAF1911]|uniref:sensor histidine kinase n=1 Tax=Streptomyces sp. ZAF1911 TaxID=2944129 RepID=UPI00237A2438|nr:HAMP domain-containing sensor histidine kinase [Streptomyces sp. ZAF1911]MDD9376895.1 HAMP domain-containing sensor histidine kinase [Streptomyces sp. ZAF1911]
MTRSRARTMWSRASLRSRVLLLAVALLSAGFAAFALVTGNSLRGYLEDRVDSQLRAAAQVFSLLPPTVVKDGAEQQQPAGLADFSTDVLGNPVITYVTEDGAVESSIASLGAANRPSDAQGPALPRLDKAEVADRKGRPFTVSSTQGDARWRVIAVPRTTRAGPLGITAPTAATGSVIVATPMAEADSTVSRMWRNYQSTGFGLLVVLAVAGWFAVRSGLRPLSRIEQTAAEIAGGDLSCRVPELAGPNTELGRLSAALNGMLGQLETAFAARAESEARMSRFVADASHELRTPLAGIKGLTDLHRMGALADLEDIDSTMDRIARESDRLTRLVNDMLLLARLDEHALKATGDTAGHPGPESPPSLDLAPTDLRTLAADALHDVRALDPSRPVTLTGPAGEGAPTYAPALADESRLRQVVTNLVGNAVTHTPPGTPIRIGVGSVEGHAVLEVADQGPGLAPEQSARIFERFYRADTSRNRATGGAGLGLAIVQSLVTAHAGHVEVDSAPGRGTTFRILLTRLSDQQTPTDPPQPAALRG